MSKSITKAVSYPTARREPVSRQTLLKDSIDPDPNRDPQVGSAIVKGDALDANEHRGGWTGVYGRSQR